jgi:serine/threonine-protein kinase
MADRDLAGRRLGDFVLREQIGEGGHGAVYRSDQPLLQREVVVKVLHEQRRSNDHAKERFLREAQLASRLDHPFAAHVYAFGVEDEGGLMWIAMELVQGITLDEWLRQRGAMRLDQFVPFFEGVAEVVQAAHERGVVHRDLKPSNVMVIERGGRMIPKLLDFGIAKVDHDVELPAADDARGVGEAVTRTDPAARDWRLTRSGAGMGSWGYMSPEQWDDARAVGRASDIYSLGVLAYKALTGRVPFTAESEREYYRHHLATQVPPLGCDFSSAVDRVIRRALAKTPEARHASALELASELRAALRASRRGLGRVSGVRLAIGHGAAGRRLAEDRVLGQTRSLVLIAEWERHGIGDCVSCRRGEPPCGDHHREAPRRRATMTWSTLPYVTVQVESAEAAWVALDPAEHSASPRYASMISLQQEHLYASAAPILGQSTLWAIFRTVEAVSRPSQQFRIPTYGIHRLMLWVSTAQRLRSSFRFGSVCQYGVRRCKP